MVVGVKTVRIPKFFTAAQEIASPLISSPSEHHCHRERILHLVLINVLGVPRPDYTFIPNNISYHHQSSDNIEIPFHSVQKVTAVNARTIEHHRDSPARIPQICRQPSILSGFLPDMTWAGSSTHPETISRDPTPPIVTTTYNLVVGTEMTTN